MQECEVILLKEPNAPEILAMLGDIETRLQAAGHQIATGGSKNGLIVNSSVNGTNGLGHTGSMSRPWSICRTGGTPRICRTAATSISQSFWSMQQLFTEDEVASAWKRSSSSNKDLSGQALARVAPGQALPAGYRQAGCGRSRA